MRAKAFIARITHHLKELHVCVNLLNVYGFAFVKDYLSREEANELAYLIHLGQTAQLANIPPPKDLSADLQATLDPTARLTAIGAGMAVP